MSERATMLTTSEAAKILNCNPRTIAVQCDRGQIASHRIGNRRRIALEDLVRFADERGITMRAADRFDPAIQRERIRIDPRSFLANEAELAWRRTACFIYRNVLREFVDAISRQRPDRTSVLSAEQRVDLLAKARMIGIAESEAERSSVK
jgi:excisionase family DNA binding protein